MRFVWTGPVLFACAVLALGSPSAVRADAEVALYSAALRLGEMQPGSYCPACYVLDGVVEVRNVAYAKQVDVFYSTGGVWRVQPAAHLGPGEGDREAWSFAIATGYLASDPHVELAVRYRVDGQEYWDNHFGQNYRVTPSTPHEPDTEVWLRSAQLGRGLGCYGLCGDFSARIRVRNLAYAKRVSLWYSLDGAAWTEAAGRYDHDLGGGYEQWSVYLPYLFPRDPRIEFAIRYEVLGQTYWDNHFSVNHVR